MAMYGQRAIDRNMNINELMVFFNTLSQSMPRNTVMSQARGYLHRFCQSVQVHCKLYPIMMREFWERKGSPRLVCEECKGLVNCPRTGFVHKKEPVCWLMWLSWSLLVVMHYMYVLLGAYSNQSNIIIIIVCGCLCGIASTCKQAHGGVREAPGPQGSWAKMILNLL